MQAFDRIGRADDDGPNLGRRERAILWSLLFASLRQQRRRQRDCECGRRELTIVSKLCMAHV